MDFKAPREVGPAASRWDCRALRNYTARNGPGSSCVPGPFGFFGSSLRRAAYSSRSMNTFMRPCCTCAGRGISEKPQRLYRRMAACRFVCVSRYMRE